MKISEHQFGEMHKRLSEGGFTYNPRSRQFVTSGYSVAAHPAAELRIEGGAKREHLEGYVAGSAPLWQQQKAKGRGQEMIGGWKDVNADVLDVPKVFPATTAGHAKSRQAQILRGQQASFALHTFEEDPNPWYQGDPTAEPPKAPGRMAGKFPEFAHLAATKPQEALNPEKYPEIESWASAPTRQAEFHRQRKRASGG